MSAALPSGLSDRELRGSAFYFTDTRGNRQDDDNTMTGSAIGLRTTEGDSDRKNSYPSIGRVSLSLESNDPNENGLSIAITN